MLCPAGKTGTLVIPATVNTIGSSAFYLCQKLTGLYFRGNAPSLGYNPFYAAGSMTVFILPHATNWDQTFGGYPVALWLPQIQAGDVGFGVRSNQFGFDVNWTSGQVVVVEACTNLSDPDWQPVQTNTLTSDPLYFSDPQWTNYPGRFYRLRSP